METNWVENEELLDWYLLTPVQRWKESERLWSFYLMAGGSLESEPDSQSPFNFEETRSGKPLDGRPGLRFLRRGGV